MSKIAVPAEREQPRKPRGRAKDNEAKRRRERTWAPRAPDLGEVLASPGHPLDPGLRREMESRFGHDFTQVRIHTDQDAAALAVLLGADAVTVGQDVYFGDGTFQPWSADGRRLLAHELLHTMQVPHVFGALRAGRDAGAVSLPQEPLEQKAEDEARHDSGHADSRPDGQDRDVHERAPAAAWLRYATVTAEQRRTEQLDPATLVDRLAAGILRSLRGDPGDWSKRVRLHLVRLGPELRSAVLDKLEVRLPSAPYEQVRQVVGELERDAAPLQVDAQPGPQPVSEPDAEAEQADRDEVRDSDAEHVQQLQDDDAPRHQQAREEQEREDQERADQTAQADKQRAGDEQAAGQRNADVQAADADARKTDTQDEQQAGEQAEQHQKQQAQAAADSKEQAEKTGEKERAEQNPAQQERNAKRPGGPAGTPPPPLGLMAGTQPMAPGPATGAGGAPPVATGRVEAIAEEPGGPLARHHLTAKPGKTDEQQPHEVPPGEQPEGLDADPAGQVADVELPAPNVPQLPPQRPVPPDAYLPRQDMDVSAVPTGDEIKLPASGVPPAPPVAPSFPAPPAPEQQSERPGEPDPVEKRLQQEDLRDGAEIALAPGQIGPDAAAQEPDAVPEAADQAAPAPDATAAGAADGASGAAAAGGPDGQAVTADAAGQRTGGGDAAARSTDGEAAAGPGAGPGAAADTDGLAGVATVPLAQDASLEAGGGPCAGGPEPSTGSGLDGTAATAGGGGGGGGGAPAAADDQPEPPAPDVTQQEPTSALATVGQLPAATMLNSLGGVDASVNRSVGQERAELAAHPPQLERPSGAPQTLHGEPQEAEPASYAPDEVPKVVPKDECKQAQPEDKTVLGAPAPVAQVQAPKVTGDESGKITDADVQNIEEAVDSVPTTDPVLDQASVGLAPTVKLSCDTDPALTDEQQARLKDKSDAILATGREDAAKPLGENRIYPDVPHEILKAQVPAVPAAGQAGAAAAVGPDGGAADSVTAGGTAGSTAGGTATPGGARAGGADAAGDQAISAVAQQERGPQIQEAVGQGQSQMVTGQQDKQQQEETAQKDHEEKVAAAIKEHTDEQTAERVKAKREARDQRKTWQTEQDTAVGDADTKARKHHDDTRGDIARAKTDTDGQIGDQQKVDNRSIADKRREAEEEARKERDKEKEPSGWLSRIGSAIASAFDHLVSFVKDAFNRARKFVQGVIDKFKNFVIGLIEKARQAIVGFINKLADALIEIGNKLLAAFPGLRDKFRKRIEKFRDDAIHAVNKIANRLKTAVTKLLDALSKALTKLFDALEKALVAAVQFVRNAIVGVINFVKNAIDMLGDFAALVKDVAVDPGGWISKLKTAVVDGINIYLWDAVKTAVKKWFDDKVEEITGLGKMVIDVLRKGCFSMAMIARKVWDALISALPGMLVQTAIEQLLAIVIPGAGAIMAIVRGAIAAYHAVSKIIAAIGKFIAFLKAVRSGQAAPPFAEALAAGVVALLEFIASYLMSKLASAAKGVAGALKGIADRIVKFLARGAKAVKKGMGAAVNVAKRGAKAAAGVIKRGFHAVVRGGKHGAKWIAAKAKVAVKAIGRGTRALGKRLAKTRLGKSLANAGHKLKAKYQQFKAKTAAWRDRYKKWREDRKKNKPTPEQRLEKATARIRPKVAVMLRRGVPDSILKSVLAAIRIWNRLTGLDVAGTGRAFSIEAILNPSVKIAEGVRVDRDALLKCLDTVSNKIIKKGAERAGEITLGIPRKGTVDFETGKHREFPVYNVPHGVGLPAVLAKAIGMKRRGMGRKEILSFVTDKYTAPPRPKPAARGRSLLAKPAKTFRSAMEVARRQSWGGINNKIVKMMSKGRESDAKIDYTGIASDIARSGSRKGQKLAADIISFGAGGRSPGPDGDKVAFLGVLMVVQEGHRDVSAVTTTAMTFQNVVGGADLKKAITDFPMAMDKAGTASRELSKHLDLPQNRRSRIAMSELAEKLAEREIAVVSAWLKTVKIDVGKGNEKQIMDRLCKEIEDRIMKHYFPENQASGRDQGTRP